MTRLQMHNIYKYDITMYAIIFMFKMYKRSIYTNRSLITYDKHIGTERIIKQFSSFLLFKYNMNNRV